MRKNDVVQFNEKHKWCGCIGIITEIKPSKIMVGVPIPEKGTAYIFCKSDEIERIGNAIFVVNEGDV